MCLIVATGHKLDTIEITMATIRQRTNGHWQAVVRRRGHPDQSRTFPNKTEAVVWAQTVETDMRRGIFQSTTDAERTTLAELILLFEREFAPFHYRQRSDGKEAWRFQLARIKEVLGNHCLASIDQRLIANYRDQRLSGTRLRAAVTESTVRKELYLLSKLFSFAQTDKNINLPRGNPVPKVRKPSDSKGRERRLSEEEMTALMGECKRSRNPWLYPAVVLALETSMRQAELLWLRWTQVDINRKFALLADTERIKNAEQRAVPLSPLALKILGEIPVSATGFVLPLDRQTLYKAFTYACQRAEVGNFTFHDLRHEAISRLAERGDFNVLELAAISGHKTLQMLKRYTHLQASSLAEKLAATPTTMKNQTGTN